MAADKTKVLVIEDDVTLMDAYSTILMLEGYDVYTAPDGQAGLAVAEEKQPHVIILDLLMPNMSGMDFLKAYDVKNKHPQTRIVVFSNVVSPDYIKEALALGAVKYLTKPTITPREMAQVVQELAQQ